MHTLYMRVAYEEGIYRRNGLDVGEVISLTSGPLMTQALAADHIDVGDTDAEGVLNAAVGFDERTLAPTFELRLGVPGASAGINIAQRLGLNAQIVAGAREKLNTQTQDVSRFLDRLHRRLPRGHSVAANDGGRAQPRRAQHVPNARIRTRDSQADAQVVGPAAIVLPRPRALGSSRWPSSISPIRRVS